MEMQRLLRYGVLTGLFVIPFIPLIISNSMFFPFITGKHFAFRIIVELILGGWVILALLDARYRPRISSVAGAIAVFLFVLIAAALGGENPTKSIWSNFERMEGIVGLLHFAAYFLVLCSMLTTEKLWTRWFNTSLAASAIVVLCGLGQLAGLFRIYQSGVRIDSTFGNATYLSIYMLFHIFIAGILLLRQRSGWTKAVYGGLIALEVAVLYFTATRGAILGLFGGAVLTTLLVALFERERKNLRRGAFAALTGLLILAGGFFVLKDSSFVTNNEVLSRISSISLEAGSTRLTVWGMGYQGFLDRPILGWGQESFNYVFNTYYDPSLYNQEEWFDRVHNVVFDWLVAGGALGLLAYLSIFLTALYLLWWKSRLGVAERALVTGLFAGYFFYNFFTFDNFGSYLMFFSLLAYIHVRSRAPEQGAPSQAQAVPNHIKVFAPAIAVATLALVYFVNIPAILAAQDLLGALSQQPQAQGGLKRNLELFKSALGRTAFGDQEAREQLVQATMRILPLNVDLAVRQDFFNLAASEIDTQIKKTPNDARQYLFMGTLLDVSRQYDQALPYLLKASELSPTKQTILFEIGLNRLNASKHADALGFLKKSYELEEKNNNALVFYAVGLIYNGKFAEAKELFTARFGSDIIDDDRLVKAYYDAKLFSKVVDIWKLRVSKDSTNPRYQMSLAAAYLSTENRPKAIEALEAAKKLDPKLAEQIDFLISEIRAGRNP